MTKIWLSIFLSIIVSTHRGQSQASEGEFPLWISKNAISQIPVEFERQSVRIIDPKVSLGFRREREILFTKSAVYPDEKEAIKKDPRYGWKFNRVLYGYLLKEPKNGWELRFRVYYPSELLSEKRKDHSELAQKVLQLILRFCVYGEEYLFPSSAKAIDIWLCERGKIGGEQFGENLYLYDINTPREPPEWIREIAHEYGHCLFPNINGFKAPEPWAGGYLGELFLVKWLIDNVETGELERWEVSKEELREIWARKSENQLKIFLREGPLSKLLSEGSRESMDYFLGFALYIDSVHNPLVLSQTFLSTREKTPRDFMKGYEKTISQLKPLSFAVSSLWCFQHSSVSAPNSTAKELHLKPSQTISCWLYLPKRTLKCYVVGKSASSVSVFFGGNNLEEKVSLSEGETVFQITSEEIKPGWQQFKIINSSEGDLFLRRVVLSD